MKCGKNFVCNKIGHFFSCLTYRCERLFDDYFGGYETKKVSNFFECISKALLVATMFVTESHIMRKKIAE